MKNIFAKISDGWYALGAAVTVAMVSETASAATMGEVADGVKEQLSSVGKLIVGGAFVVGIVMVAGGLMKLKEAVDSHGQQVKYGDGLWRLALGAGLVAVPAVTSVGAETFGLAPDEGINGVGVDIQ